MPVAGKRPNDGKLLCRRHASIDAGARSQCIEAGFSSLLGQLDVMASNHLVLVEGESCVPCNGGGRLRVIARNHGNLDACGTAVGNRLGHFGTDGILHPDHPEEDEIDEVVSPKVAALSRGNLAVGKCQHAKTSGRHLLLLSQKGIPVDRHEFRTHVHPVRHADQRLRGTFGEDAHDIAALVEGGGVFQVRLVGDAGEKRVVLRQRLMLQACLACGGQQGDVDGVTDPSPAALITDQCAFVGH